MYDCIKCIPGVLKTILLNLLILVSTLFTKKCKKKNEKKNVRQLFYEAVNLRLRALNPCQADVTALP